MPSALRRAFLFQAVAKVFAKGVKMINDRMSAANKGILSTARIKEGSKIQTGSHLQPHSNVGFFVLWESKLPYMLPRTIRRGFFAKGLIIKRPLKLEE
jgi:hypothetical protein